MENPINVGIEVDHHTAEAMKSLIETETGETADRFEISNVDGTAAGVLIYVQVAASMISALAPILVAFISQRKVYKIKVGEVEIQNPSPEQVEVLVRQQAGAKKVP